MTQSKWRLVFNGLILTVGSCSSRVVASSRLLLRRWLCGSSSSTDLFTKWWRFFWCFKTYKWRREDHIMKCPWITDLRFSSYFYERDLSGSIQTNVCLFQGNPRTKPLQHKRFHNYFFSSINSLNLWWVLFSLFKFYRPLIQLQTFYFFHLLYKIIIV